MQALGKHLYNNYVTTTRTLHEHYTNQTKFKKSLYNHYVISKLNLMEKILWKQVNLSK